jgi:hypothetical protein
MSRLTTNDVLIGAGAALAGLALGSALLPSADAAGENRKCRAVAVRRAGSPRRSATVLAARRLNRAAGTLATSVLADSAV